MSQTDTLVEELLEEKVVLTAQKDIVLYDDDVNTFDWVIESLVDVCEHKTIQAEQCTYLVHHTGKCAVKRGSFEDLKPLCTELLNRGLTAEIE